MNDPLRAKLNLFITVSLAFALGLGMASALDLTPMSLAAGDRDAPEWIIGAPPIQSGSLGEGFAEIVDRIAPAVVTVYAEREGDPTSNPGLRLPPGVEEFVVPWSGSGFVISADGYVVTNNHVVEGASQIDVELADQRRFSAELVGRDPQTDVALLKLAASGLTVAPLGFADSTRVGEWVLAIGSPGFGGVGAGPLETTVTAGIVSAKGRSINILSRRTQFSIEDFIQTDAAINRGNSGGPLVNARGEVIGINTVIASETGFNQGYGFAIPIDLAREVIDDLIEHGEVRRAVIGVLINGVTSADAKYYELDRVAGAKVQNFSDESSPARLAGLQPGDIILSVEGQPVIGVPDVQRRIRQYEPGETVNLDIVRRDKTRGQVSVELAAAEDEAIERPTRLAARDRNGRGDALGVLEVGSLTTRTRNRLNLPAEVGGIVITEATAGGPLGRALGRTTPPQDIVIEDVNGQLLEGPEDYERLISGLDAGDVVSLRVHFSSRSNTGIPFGGGAAGCPFLATREIRGASSRAVRLCGVRPYAVSRAPRADQRSLTRRTSSAPPTMSRS
jgi:serine protease Do